MFIKEDNSKFDEYPVKYPYTYDVPESVLNIELTLKPHTKTGPMSGSYLLAQYLESILFCYNGTSTSLTDSDIQGLLYDTIKDSEHNNYISLASGLNNIASALSLSQNNIFYITNKEAINTMKHFIHKYCFMVVELLPNTAYCMTSDTDRIDFNVVTDGTVLDDNITKGFLCVGYDSTGFILMNSLGTSYGSGGFIHISNDVFKQNFVKAATINNIYY